MTFEYNEISETFDKYRSYNDDEMKKIIQFAEIIEGMKILDLGCGTGNVAVQLMKLLNVDIVGVDISEEMLKIAREKSIEVLYTDIDNDPLPFPNASFNVVIGTYIIHQIHNLEHLLSESYRVLRNGSVVFLTSSHVQIENQHPVVNRFFPSFVSIDKARFPSIEKIEKSLNLAGFTNIEQAEIHIEDIPIDQDYLLKVKGKYVSTYHLLPSKEFDVGIKKLETYINNMHEPEFREWRGTLIRGCKVSV